MNIKDIITKAINKYENENNRIANVIVVGYKHAEEIVEYMADYQCMAKETAWNEIITNRVDFNGAKIYFSEREKEIKVGRI